MLTVKKTTHLIGYGLLLRLLSRASLWIFASSSLSFGLSAALAPLIGFFSSASRCFGFYALRTCIYLATSWHLPGFTYYLPTLAGSLALSSQSRLVEALIPALCMATFILHPIGASSWLYSLYWLIPIGISIVPKRSIFLRSLSSTFITHAVGSVLYIYTHPTTTLFWHALAPQVWLERLAYALILTSCYYGILFITQFNPEGSLCQNRLPSL